MLHLFFLSTNEGSLSLEAQEDCEVGHFCVAVACSIKFDKWTQLVCRLVLRPLPLFCTAMKKLGRWGAGNKDIIGMLILTLCTRQAIYSKLNHLSAIFVPTAACCILQMALDFIVYTSHVYNTVALYTDIRHHLSCLVSQYPYVRKDTTTERILVIANQ